MVLKNLPPLAGLTFNRNAYPTLTRGATFCRRYAAVFGCASRDILDRRYSRKARVHGIEFVSEFLNQDTRKKAPNCSGVSRLWIPLLEKGILRLLSGLI